VRTALGVLFLLSVFAVIGTQSRGAFIALVVFAGYFWLKSSNKVAIAAASGVCPSNTRPPGKSNVTCPTPGR